MKRYLITTEDENTWRLDEPVLFLGVWCKRNNRQHIWSKIDAILAEPYLKGNTSHDDEHLEVLFNQLLAELTDVLNIFHNESHSERYWNILLGPWLRQYLKVVINRYKALELTLNQYSISGTSIYKAKNFNLVTKNTAEFNTVINDSTWNSILFTKILPNFSQFNLKINILDIDAKIKTSPYKNNASFKRNFFLFLANLFNKVYKDSDAFIIKSYLSVINEIKLQISLWQIPKLWQAPCLDYEDFDEIDRSRINLKYDEYTGVDKIVRELIVELLPTCYLESYKNISNQVNFFSWPANPKFIFTSNSFAYDEGFKFWTAKKVESGVPYYVGQHGTNYGTMKSSDNWTEVTTCDKFISWGWGSTHKDINVVPAFNLKTAGMSNLQYDKGGSLLLIERGPGLFDGPYDRQFIHSVYQKDMLDFFDNFPGHIRRDFVVRLHHGSSDLDSEDAALWNKHARKIKLNFGFDPINNLISKSRVVVITYDSATILELLSLNVPIVCFWHGDLGRLSADAIPYYELLVNVKILHTSSEFAAKHITTHWDDLDSWWCSEKVQDARKVFCEKYSKRVKNPILTLRNLLLDSV